MPNKPITRPNNIKIKISILEILELKTKRDPSQNPTLPSFLKIIALFVIPLTGLFND